EVLQKAVRMLDIGAPGLDPDFFIEGDVRKALRVPTSLRVFAIARALAEGVSPQEIHALTGIDTWFLHGISEIVRMRCELAAGTASSPDLIRRAKRLGFSDATIARLTGASDKEVREVRQKYGIIPKFARIDTLAAEFPAE